MDAVRRAAVAGLFYPLDARALRAQIDALLTAAGPTDAPTPKLLIVPHAGYRYSGAMAARAYACLRPVHITRVVLLGPAHRAALAALAVPQASAFITPLGRVSIDQPAVESLAELPQCVRDDAPHEDEHALEVQLPFLQALLGPFTLVPIVVGDVPAKAVAQALECVWGGDETLVVVSSDLSHYLPYASAQAVDRTTVDRMLALDATLEPENACGARAVNGALLCARKHGLQPRLLGLCNSGDTAGDKRRVVGYASLALETPR